MRKVRLFDFSGENGRGIDVAEVRLDQEGDARRQQRAFWLATGIVKMQGRGRGMPGPYDDRVRAGQMYLTGASLERPRLLAFQAQEGLPLLPEKAGKLLAVTSILNPDQSGVVRFDEILTPAHAAEGVPIAAGALALVYAHYALRLHSNERPPTHFELAGVPEELQPDFAAQGFVPIPGETDPISMIAEAGPVVDNLMGVLGRYQIVHTS